MSKYLHQLVIYIVTTSSCFSGTCLVMWKYEGKEKVEKD